MRVIAVSTLRQFWEKHPGAEQAIKSWMDEATPIRTEADYKAALKLVSSLMESDPEGGTAEGDQLDVLTTLVQAYEARHFPIDPPAPIEAIKFRMEQAGMSAKDLEPMIGRSIVSMKS